jgi:hypothetical protein
LIPITQVLEEEEQIRLVFALKVRLRRLFFWTTSKRRRKT